MTVPDMRIRAAINDIQGWLNQIPVPGEAVVRQAIILRLLDAAGFNIWNPLEVVPEETNATGHRADFLVRAGEGKFALEIKGMNVALNQSHYQQAATYAVNEGTRWAIVTNGRVWVVIDEHLPGRWDERVALKLELGQDEFADDLALLLNLSAWRDDLFVAAIDQITERQKWRHDAEKTRREKTPVIEEIQRKYGLGFELAVEAAIDMHRVTEAEGEILRGATIAWQPYVAISSSAPAELKKGIVTEHLSLPGKSSEPHPARQVEFAFKARKAKATAIWNEADNIWTIKKGSTALDRVPDYGKWLATEREKLISEGILRRIGEGLLEYVEDHDYTSPSNAAFYIAGRSCNGWECWKDSSGQPASAYRKSN
ncbi:DUF4357 domain-containing protein [Deinococcus cavernae]|uniref:DUF4357 domain-containing protein n=1 Tax=Deinococcus cavernae TaxID=2320857 RepID=A0A418V681_9DEIO|nr:DUF4357 domain-containing protein [Deinococcus cavernae]RJF71604.1 DUF4357 domain-containing protein [Deinococcus cavernae]